MSDLIIVHFSPSEKVDSFLLKGLFPGTLGCLHLVFDFHELLVNSIELGLSNFHSLVKLKEGSEMRPVNIVNLLFRKPRRGLGH